MVPFEKARALLLLPPTHVWPSITIVVESDTTNPCPADADALGRDPTATVAAAKQGAPASAVLLLASNFAQSPATIPVPELSCSNEPLPACPVISLVGKLKIALTVGGTIAKVAVAEVIVKLPLPVA
jgi:hypothetical protein